MVGAERRRTPRRKERGEGCVWPNCRSIDKMTDPKLPPSEPIQPSIKDAAMTKVGTSPDEQKPRHTIPARSADAAKPKTEFERKLAMADRMVKMAAIVIAGTFAFVKFGLLDWPSLQKTFRVEGNLEWLQDEGGPSSCSHSKFP